MVLAFSEALRLGTGQRLTPEKWQKSAEKRARIVEQTDLIAEALEAQGVPTWCAPHDPVTALGELSGLVERECQKRRHIMILPEVARAERAGLVRDLTYFLEHHPKRQYVRYGVLTSGQRVRFGGDLRGRRQSFHKNMTRWVDEARARYDIEVLFRGDEYTFKYDLLNNGTHFHVNVAFLPHTKLNRAEWAEFLSWTKRRLGGARWKDNGKLKDVRELVKYICKLGTGENDKTGSVGIDQLSPADLAWFHCETFKAQNVACLGSFGAFRRDLKETGQRIAYIRGQLRRVDKCPSPPRSTEERVREAGQVENVVISRQLPNHRFGAVAEPCLLVMGYNPNPKTEAGRKGLEFIRSCQAQAQGWARENDPDYNVHIGTIITQPTLRPPVGKELSERGVDASATPRRRPGRVKRVIVRPEPTPAPGQKRLFHRPDGTTTPMRRVVVR